MTHFTYVGFRIWSKNINNGTQHIAILIIGRIMHFKNNVALNHMRKYRSTINTEMKWLICKRPEKLRSGMVRSPCLMKRLAQVLNFNISTDLNHATRKYKLR